MASKYRRTSGFDNPRLPIFLKKVAKKAAVVAAVGASYFCIHSYLENRHYNNLVEQVSALESMVESGNAVGAKPLASSLYEELHDEDDPRLKALYDDVVFPAYKRMNAR